ncbi:hypothetical protein AB0G35_31190 [Streptomyces sp. NPDC021749]|uniref:hypothetical protein n=1 Tax=Streptomyces sp. NPDC021749 TaxID=3154905 RepID=UPI0033E840F1
MASALTLCAVNAPPTQAADSTVVACSEKALVDAVNEANAAGGGSLNLAPFCTYTLTSAHSAGGAGGPAGVPNITTPISMTGLVTEIVRAPGAAPFRIFEVDGPSHDPAAHGQLSLNTLTLTRGNAGLGVGGAIANLGGVVNLTASSIRDSAASYGGGIYSDNSLVVSASTVHDNIATVAGGGIYKNAGSVLLLVSPVTNNSPANCAATPPLLPDC